MRRINENKVLVAMSGGVDSSVAAKLLTDRGYECVGCTMKLYHNEDAGIPQSHTCCSLDDIEDARSVSYKLGMPYYVFNFSDGFREKVIQKFVDSYLSGITPNPCIDCNRYMKFDQLFERATIMDCKYVATGHYARIDQDENGLFRLRKGLDPTKDQSYVLYSMTQEQLSRTIFPLGDMSKNAARDLAEDAGLINARKPDSQDICFAPDGDYARIIELFSGKKSEPGNYVDVDGNYLGKHKGIIRYTLGQHRGLGLSLPKPMYVCKIDTETNTVVLGDSEHLFHNGADIKDFNWISGKAPNEPIRCKAKVRYRHQEQPATVYPYSDSGVKLVFDDKQRAITPGQAAVLYDGDIVLGGGVITSFFDSKPLEEEVISI